MKVAIVTCFPADPAAPCGGVGSVSVNLVRALARFDDLHVHVVTADRACKAPVQSEWGQTVVHRLPWAGGSMLRNAVGPGRRQISEFLRQLRPDVVHTHDTYGLMVKGLAIPRVFTVHGFIHADTLIASKCCAWLRSRIWRWAETAAWADQPHIISISPYVRERLTGIATGVIHDIDNPVSGDFFDGTRREVRGTIFSAAHIGHGKNTLGLVKGFIRLIDSGSDAQLRLAGAASDIEYEKQVRDLVEARAMTDRVRFLGRVDTRQVREELASASVFALASLQENAPMGIAEAMAVGVPVVTANRCGMPYMVRDGETGFLVDPKDPDDIAWRLGQLLADDQMRKRMGERARQIALDRFHPDSVARRTRQVYLRAMQDYHGRDRS